MDDPGSSGAIKLKPGTLYFDQTQVYGVQLNRWRNAKNRGAAVFGRARVSMGCKSAPDALLKWLPRALPNVSGYPLA